jgi:hypothetical protein
VSSAPTASSGVELFRHTLAALAYRAGKAVRNAPADFAGFRSSDTTRTPGNILAHMGDLMDWTLSILNGAQVWKDSRPIPWEEEVLRFHAAVGAVDACLAAAAPAPETLNALFRGPIADAFTHVGQLTLLRRMAGSPVRGENYFIADIQTGRVGPDQAPPRKEFG